MKKRATFYRHSSFKNHIMDTEQLVTDKSLPVGIEFYTYFVLTCLSQYENLIPHKPQITCILQKGI